MKNISKELGFGKWLLQVDGEGEDERLYLSKFDPIEAKNDDEYRIYFFIKDDGIQIVRRFKIKSYKHKTNINTSNKFYKEAEKILNTYFDLNYSKNTYKAS